MPRTWASVVDSQKIYTEDDFKQALYQLVCSQVLYEREHQHAVSYGIIAQYRGEFREATDLLGLRLEHSDNYRFFYVIPYTAKQPLLDTTETLLMLVLRRMYHDKALVGEISAGEVVVSLDELLSAYRASSKRELPNTVGELKDLITGLRRYGVAKPGKPPEGDAQPFTIVILPAIAEILNDAALGRLGAYQQAAVDAATEEGGATEGDGNETA